MADIPVVNRAKAIAYLKDLITAELQKLDISEERLGWMMGGLSQGTINKLRKGKFLNMPDFDTLEAIAFYYGKSMSEFMALLESEACESLENFPNQRVVMQTLYNTDSLELLADFSATSTAILKSKVMQGEVGN